MLLCDHHQQKTGFTLIELLVVIAIIAVLLAVILPSLRAAKELASGAVCLSNQKQLSLAWVTYTEDNNSRLVGGSTSRSSVRGTLYRWVEGPSLSDTVLTPASTSQYSLETRRNGIRVGKLFPYLEDEDVYHCPGDRSNVRLSEPYAVYRSYSITGLMNGEDFVRRVSGINSPIAEYKTTTAFGDPEELRVAEKFGDISSPSMKHVFIEEDVTTRGQMYNYGSFVMLWGGAFSWQDWPAYYHNESSTVGFADGHAERYRWRNPDTLKLVRGEIVLSDLSEEDNRDNVDLYWMIKGYIPKRHR